MPRLKVLLLARKAGTRMVNQHDKMDASMYIIKAGQALVMIESEAKLASKSNGSARMFRKDSAGVPKP